MPQKYEHQRPLLLSAWYRVPFTWARSVYEHTHTLTDCVQVFWSTNHWPHLKSADIQRYTSSLFLFFIRWRILLFVVWHHNWLILLSQLIKVHSSESNTLYIYTLFVQCVKQHSFLIFLLWNWLYNSLKGLCSDTNGASRSSHAQQGEEYHNSFIYSATWKVEGSAGLCRVKWESWVNYVWSCRDQRNKV